MAMDAAVVSVLGMFLLLAFCIVYGALRFFVFCICSAHRLVCGRHVKDHVEEFPDKELEYVGSLEGMVVLLKDRVVELETSLAEQQADFHDTMMKIAPPE